MLIKKTKSVGGEIVVNGKMANWAKRAIDSRDEILAKDQFCF